MNAAYLRVCLIVLALFLHPAPAASEAPTSVFRPQTFVLDNGMQVVVIENHRSPVVAQMVWYKIGAADEEAGKSGLAHFFEHLMFKATKSIPAGEFSKIVARHGGRDNAFTSQDYTAYFQSVPKNTLETIMRHEADRMRNLVLTDDTVYPERDVIIEERKQRVDNDPASILDEAVSAALYTNHPYAIPIIGWQHEIEKLTTADAIDFYNKHYQPRHAILIVSGDVTATEVKTLAEKYYGVIPNNDSTSEVSPSPAVRDRTISPPRFAQSYVKLADPRVQQEKWQRLWVMPSINHATQRTPDEVYDLLAEILGGSSTSFLYGRLVREQKVATSVYAYFSNALDYDTFVVGALPAPNVSLEQLEQAVSDALQAFLAEPIDSRMLKRIKNQYLAQAIFDRDSLIGPAMILGHALVLGRTIADVERYPQKINQVTQKAIAQAAQELLGTIQPLTAWLQKQDPPPQ
ncbi:MAG: insulinase family protein [Alphaproteobacteria bacterium GM202ARS2]|nr:insulinase family protein [Alphaproteobacteria bacterium GM202ARS2]